MFEKVLSRLETSAEYEFSDSTREDMRAHADESADDAFERGSVLFQAGRVVEALRAFESVVLKDASHSQAWSMLGSCHAENDEDRKAITCFLKAREAVRTYVATSASYILSRVQ